MPNGYGANWQRTFTETIDQRQIELPPAWSSNNAPRLYAQERGRTVTESGRNREIARAVISLLAQAQEMVVLSSFLLADHEVEDAILAAAQRGVRPYVLLAAEARLGASPSEDEFDKEVIAQHKAMLSRLGGYALFRTAGSFHAKAIVVDPYSNPTGLLLTANLTKEAFERNNELAVSLTGNEVAEITAYLKWAIWEAAEHELIEPKDGFKATVALGKITHPSGSRAIVATTAHTTSLLDEVFRLVTLAKSRLIISSFGWDADHRVISDLCARARGGLEVTVLARLRPVAMPALLKLADAGVTVLGFPWLHAKAIWADNGEALLMSANLQTVGLDQGFELGVRLDAHRADELRDRLIAWQKTAPWRLLSKPHLGEIRGQAKLWRGGRFEDVIVKDSEEIDLGICVAASTNELTAPRPSLQKNGILPRLAHDLRCVWRVRAPRLEPNAKQHYRLALDNNQRTAYEPPVFREPDGSLVVAIKSTRDLERAQEVMSEVGARAIVVEEGSF